MVRLALVTSVTCSAGQLPDQPAVHGAEEHLAALGALAQPVDVVEQPAQLRAGEVGGQRQARCGPGTAPRRTPRPARAAAARCGCPARRWRWRTGRPVARSQTTVVSRWLVMPTAARPAGPVPADRSASETTCWTLSQISSASCSTQPGRGKICRCSRWATATISPARSKTMHREEVVPWSMAATYSAVTAAPYPERVRTVRRRRVGRRVAYDVRTCATSPFSVEPPIPTSPPRSVPTSGCRCTRCGSPGSPTTAWRCSCRPTAGSVTSS